MAREAVSSVPITRLCQVLEVSRRGYYRWVLRQQAPPTATQQGRLELAGAIRLLFHRYHERPGRRPMQGLLAQHGYPASVGRIDRLMRELGLQARRGRKKRLRVATPGPTPGLTATIRNHCLDADGHRDFGSTTPGSKVVGDITHLPTGDGPHYLATVLDLATRRVIGWAVAPVQDTTLTSTVLTQARQQGFLRADAIFHSDRGPQYTSHPFQALCGSLRVTQSLGATGVCADNAAAEAFFATLKGDLRSELSPAATAAAVLSWLQSWIEDWYNRRRPHRANAGQPPVTAWERLIQEKAAVSDP